jgi:hypothetical protein
VRNKRTRNSIFLILPELAKLPSGIYKSESKMSLAKTECSKPTLPPLLLWSLVQRLVIYPTPTGMGRQQGGPRHLLVDHPDHAWLSVKHVPNHPREGKVLCPLVCFCSGWMPGVQCVHNLFYETDGN